MRHANIAIEINGHLTSVSADMTIAAALLQSGAVRHSVRGEPRQPLCGMGICYECRAEVDGQPHQKTCQILCAPGMRVRTDG